MWKMEDKGQIPVVLNIIKSQTPRHGVIFSDDWGVLSAPQQNIEVPCSHSQKASQYPLG